LSSDGDSNATRNVAGFLAITCQNVAESSQCALEPLEEGKSVIQVLVTLQ